MGFSRQEGDLSYPGVKPVFPALQVDFKLLRHRESPSLWLRHSQMIFQSNYAAFRKSFLSLVLKIVLKMYLHKVACKYQCGKKTPLDDSSTFYYCKMYTQVERVFSSERIFYETIQ